MDRNDSVMKEALGESEVFLDFQDRLSQVARVDRPVLIIGERGTGKELAASRLHYLSRRWQGPFITLNCAALPETLIETELFGHKAGAYTGANTNRKGRFEEALSGTLFLDEIGLIPMIVQEKILRAVEYGTFERVGSSQTVDTDVRIIGATNADLPELCEQGKFKRDLLDRLSFEVLFLPPLRAREDDILLLASSFANRMALELGRRESIVFSERVLDQLQGYHWPGNIRELKNVVERAVYKTNTEVVEFLELNPFINPYSKGEENGSDLSPSPENTDESPSVKFPYLGAFRDEIKKLECEYMDRALKESKGNQKKAAEILNLTYDQFRGLYRKYKDQL